MKLHGIFRKLTNTDALLKFFSGIAVIKSKCNLYLAKITDSKPFQFILEHIRPVALFLYVILLVGCGYWFYELMIIDAKPKYSLGLVVTDSRDALAILFFGALGSVFVISFALFIIKFIYNLFHNGIESFFSNRWHALVRPASYLVILCFAFSFTGPIKTAGLTGYNQVAELVHTSRQHTIIMDKETADDLERKLSGLMKTIQKDNQE